MFLLYVGGARDFALIALGDTGYIERQFGHDGAVYFSDYPPVLRVVWMLNVVGGLTAPVLLILRSRGAFPTAVVATLAQALLLAVTFAALDRWRMLGPELAWFDIGIGVLTAAFAAYVWWWRRRIRHAPPQSPQIGG